MPNHYSQFLSSIKERIRKSQYEALKAVNKELITLYWDIGHIIIERQKKHGWGKAIVENLAGDLQAEFTGVGGFSSSNLWRMKLFYEEYANNTKLAPMVREISWSHNVCIMEKCKNNLEREFYIPLAPRRPAKRKTPTPFLSRQILDHFGTFRAMAHTDTFFLFKEDRPQIKNAKDVADLLIPRMRDLK